MNDLLRNYPTKGGYVVGKSARAEHPNMEKMPDYRPEEDLDFLPMLDPKKTSTKAIQVESSTSESQASTIVDPNEVMSLLDIEDIFACMYNESNSENEAVNVDDFPEEPDESDDEELLYEPEMDDDEEINLTCQIQATLESTEEFKEYVVETDNIDGDHKLSEGQESVEKLFVGQQWLSKEHCRDYLKDLTLDLNHSIVQVRNKKKQQEYKCKDETCPWRVYCSVLSDKKIFECKKGHFIHTCEAIHGLKHSSANARWVSKLMLESFKEHPNYNPRDFMTEAHPRALTFISDRKKGLIEGVAVNFSDRNHYHRYCFRHLYKNFKKLHPGKNLEFMTWRAARSFSEVGHKIWMDRLKEAKASVPEWFDREPVETWARAYFDRSSKCEHGTSNFCEAFNSWILDLRRLPVCKLVQKFHLLMMRFFYDREQVGKKMPDDKVVPRVTQIVDKHLYFNHEFTTQPSFVNIWQVFDTKKDISWVVNLEQHTCTCNSWKVCGIPCVHVCMFLHLYTSVCMYVQSYMHVDTYRDLYAPSIEPLNHQALWAKNSREVKPPKCGTPPGRSRCLRRRDWDEGGNSRKYMCGRCYVYGHNMSTCKGASAVNIKVNLLGLVQGSFIYLFTMPPPPSASADQTTAAPAPRNKPRTTGGGRKRRGGVIHASTSNAAPSSTAAAPSSTSTASSVPPTSEPAVPTTRGRGRGGRGTRGGGGGRGTRGGIGGATAPVPLTIITPPVPLVQVAASTTTAFGRGVGNSSTNSRQGKREDRLDGCFLRGNYGGRGGGIVMRRGGAFSSTFGRGKRPRMMDWFGTPEQWANEETLP
ncbi:hypothetical protein MKW98_008233 [Papaver atlanticum]|uniref:SWIM-type domain-containing protein n=1 Tax=Papaver atlanticum TaxID=357466 RepID=A0AAD4X4H8_9MAGN|nr:hypothetical protein MKW98_008233 [Papaver atlanticum]